MHSVSYFASWIYFLYCFFFIIIIDKSNNKTNKKYGQIAFIAIFLFAVLRYGIGSDYPAYWNMVTGNTEYERTYEFLSGIIISFVQSVGFPPLVFIVFSTITLFCYKYVINKYSSNCALSWYFYFTFPLLCLQDCSTIRNAGAMGCFFIAFAFLDNKQYLKALLFAAWAPLFHDTGYIVLILLLLPVLEKIELKINILILLGSFFVGSMVAGIVSAYLGDSDVGMHFLNYVEGETPGFKTFQYVIYGLNIANFVFYKKLVADNPKNATFITFVNIGLCLFTMFKIEAITANRLCCYFLLFQTLLMPSYRNILARILPSRSAANLFIILLCFALQLLMVIKYLNAYNSGGMDTLELAPYRMWIFHL